MLRSILVPLAVLALAAPAAPQDGQATLRKENACCKNGRPLPWSGYNKGVQWTQPMDDAFEKAATDRKLVMVFNLVGDLDKGGC
jgi:ABC-type sugar transport system substrate-binding protein